MIETAIFFFVGKTEKMKTKEKDGEFVWPLVIAFVLEKL